MKTMNKKIEIPKEVLDAFYGDDIRATVFWDKYSLRDNEGKQTELTPEQMWQRIANAMASVESSENKRKIWSERFYWLLRDFKFVAGGRIMFASGNKGRNVTLLNCYFLGQPEDSIEGIFSKLKEMALTYSYGGGVGLDISSLRPKGTSVSNSAIVSTGAVSFMNLMSEVTGTIGQAGRRGALLLSLDVSHPDIEDFVEIKHGNKDRVRFANISVKLTDEFMTAVEQDKDFKLHWEDGKNKVERFIKARSLWQKIIQSAHDSAEPCILLWDNAKKGSTTEYNGFNIGGTNPCSEITMSAYDCCCLGSVNLSAFVKNDFLDSAHINWIDLDSALRIAVRFLDNVLDYNKEKHPLEAQAKMSMKTRRIGVGFTGFADMLIKLGIKYDSNEALEFTEDLFTKIRDIVYDESCNLAIEKGSAKGFDPDEHLKQPFIKKLPLALRRRIKKSGLRNMAILTVPPVGSGSVLIGSSSGIEPIFALYYQRRSESLSQSEFLVYHPLVLKYLLYKGLTLENIHQMSPSQIKHELPDTFVTAHDIDSIFRVKMQGLIQRTAIDQAISSTVNLPEDVSVETVGQIYFAAWKEGVKGITVYREGSREGILKTIKDKDDSLPSEARLATNTTPIISNGEDKLICPSCGSRSYHKENGCEQCNACGYGKCST